MLREPITARGSAAWLWCRLRTAAAAASGEAKTAIAELVEDCARAVINQVGIILSGSVAIGLIDALKRMAAVPTCDLRTACICAGLSLSLMIASIF